MLSKIKICTFLIWASICFATASCVKNPLKPILPNKDASEDPKKYESIQHPIDDDLSFELRLYGGEKYKLYIKDQFQIDLPPFFWEERKVDFGIFCFHKRTNFVELYKGVYFIAIPVADLEYAGYILSSHSGIYKVHKDAEILSERGFIYIDKKRLLAVPIVRGEKTGWIKFYSYEEKTNTLVHQFDKDYTNLDLDFADASTFEVLFPILNE